MESILTALFLGIPLIFSGSLHMLIVSKNWLAPMAVAIHTPSFGANKTWRGIVVMVLGTIPGVYLMELATPAFNNVLLINLDGIYLPWLGVALGLAYVIAELPNSYVKRRLKIPPGERSNRHAYLFTFMDQADSAIGCSVVYWIFLSPPVDVCLWMIALGPLVHLLANISLFGLGLRKHAF